MCISHYTFCFQVTSSGSPFWSGPKKCPKALTFDVTDPMHMDFVEAGANLLAEVYGIEKNKNREDIANIISTVNVPAFEPKSGIQKCFEIFFCLW